MKKHVLSRLKLENKHIWFIGGFVLGLTLISIGHAALQNETPAPTIRTLSNPNVVTELGTAKVAAPDLDSDYEKLTNIEQKYGESQQQQDRLKRATSNVANYNSRRSANQ